MFQTQMLCSARQVTKTNNLSQAGTVGNWWTHAPFKGLLKPVVATQECELIVARSPDFPAESRKLDFYVQSPFRNVGNEFKT